MRRQPVDEGAGLKRKVLAEDAVLRSGARTGPPPDVSDDVERSIHGLSGGSRLPETLRSSLEPRFGADFGDVRIHTDANAAELARSVNARAFTTGRDIVFGEGEYAPETTGGKQLLSHELAHVVQQNFRQRTPSLQRQPLVDPNTICYDSSPPHPNPSAAEPELHPTYERWLASFRGMGTFRSFDTVSGSTTERFHVLGREGTRYGAAATVDTEPVPVSGRPRNGEEFIDHPTNQWVVNCLPPNLRATAYQLPADCADIAVILRHVWLSAHHRTESYHGWTVGDDAGRANQDRAGDLIEDVGSWNVDAMVNAYSNQQGNPLTDFEELLPLLHPGDILVWEHREIVTRRSGRVTSRRTGGHTQTIFNIARPSQGAADIEVLQGNQPIFSDAAIDIMESRGEANPDPDSAEGLRLRHLPGRRIEMSRAIGRGNITNPVTNEEIWGRIESATEFTVLVAAGPPRAASRPAARSRSGRSIADWQSAIGRARLGTIDGVLEAVLQEARSIIEQGASAPQPVTAADLETLGGQLGERLRYLYRRRDVDSLAQRITASVEIIRALSSDANDPVAVAPLFQAFEQAFIAAALPGSTVEERRLFSEHASVSVFLAPFASQITAFGTALGGARNFRQAQTLAEQHGAGLWQAATARSQAVSGGDNDDRPLYWARLRMIEEIRQFRSAFRLSDANRRQLVEIFEQASRGMGTADFSQAAPDQRRILVSGFDPFGLDRDVGDSNPSGAAVLALDGWEIPPLNGIRGRVEGVIFPVRFRDFDQGMIETFFRTFLTATPPVNMIMSISQGRKNYFDVEQWAGRRRSTSIEDNERATSQTDQIQPPAGDAPGDPLIRTLLPQAILDVPGTVPRDRRRSAAPDEGSGGHYLSNEIFYRERLLQINTLGPDSTLPVGHLHVPSNMTRQEIIDRVRQILLAALPEI